MLEQKRKIILAGVIFLIVVLLGGATVWLVYTQGTTGNAFQQEDIIAQKEAGGSVFDSKPSRPMDSDGDGLTDEEEKELGISPYAADSDSDGLFDREEVKVYQTDPKNSDTDGDGVSDGEEIKRGDNPKGTGKLLDLKAAIEKINQ